ncbi:MAG: hypothetical protein DCC55_38970 [Chloroflexi bacterium]|nr:MAG: hypothetical protein DCC55_38970 [Chloroflexota bacterium]
MFAGYARVVLQREFSEGQSGTQVFLAVPYRGGQEQELPVVVKLGPQELIQQEWSAAQHTRRKLPGFVEIAGEPVYLEAAETGSIPYGGLRYELAGQGLYQTESLRMYCRHAPAADLWRVLDKRLFPQLRHIWRENPRLERLRKVHATYDRVLPVNLILELGPAADCQPPTPAVVLSAGRMQTEGVRSFPAHRDAVVRLEGFVVTEIERHQRAVTLNLPQTGETRTASFRLRLQAVSDLDAYRLGEPAPIITGRVVATRQELLLAALQPAPDLPAHLNAATLPLPENPQVQLPNPLLAWPTLLQEEMPMKIGTTHGDLNMGNVLVDTGARTAQIIDCAHARRDHALYDLLRLELETVLHPLATAFFQAGQPPSRIYDFYGWLDQITRSEPHAAGHFALPKPMQYELSALATPFILLTLIRNEARDLLTTPGDWREYYTGLALYLLGALKFASLDRAPRGHQPKALAFWGALTILRLLERGQESQTTEWQWVDLTTKGSTGAATDASTEPHTTHVQVDNRSGGVYFEGLVAFNIQGDLISGGTVNKATFHGPVTGPVHTGSGDINVAGGQPRQPQASLAQLLADLRREVAASAPEAVRVMADQRIDQLEEAIQEKYLGAMESSLEWFQRQLPALAAKVITIIRHPDVVQAFQAAGDRTFAEYRRRFGS